MVGPQPAFFFFATSSQQQQAPRGTSSSQHPEQCVLLLPAELCIYTGGHSARSLASSSVSKNPLKSREKKDEEAAVSLSSSMLEERAADACSSDNAEEAAAAAAAAASCYYCENVSIQPWPADIFCLSLRRVAPPATRTLETFSPGCPRVLRVCVFYSAKKNGRVRISDGEARLVRHVRRCLLAVFVPLCVLKPLREINPQRFRESAMCSRVTVSRVCDA